MDNVSRNTRTVALARMCAAMLFGLIACLWFSDAGDGGRGGRRR